MHPPTTPTNRRRCSFFEQVHAQEAQQKVAAAAESGAVAGAKVEAAGARVLQLEDRVRQLEGAALEAAADVARLQSQVQSTLAI